MFQDIIKLTFPDGKIYDFTELPKHRTGDRVFRAHHPAPKGQVWNLRSLPMDTPIRVDHQVYVKRGGTGRTIRLRHAYDLARPEADDA